MSYVNFKIPEALMKKTVKFLTDVVEKEGKIKKGMNETTKSIERQKSKFVAIAGDVDPPEIVFHLPLICDEKNVPYVFIDTKEDLGAAVKMQVPCSAISVNDVPASVEADLKDIISKVEKLKK
ncbi:MAG: ribosomal L7Ae/L30e/S12e/Gadd45 family protein [Promethearchaeota archaeon]